MVYKVKVGVVAVVPVVACSCSSTSS